MEYKGFTEYEERDFAALNLHLRAIGAKAPKLEHLDVMSATWDSLHSVRKDAVRAAQLTLQAVADNAAEADIRKAESAHDVLMAAVDFIDGEMDRRKAFGQRTPLTPAQRGAPTGEAGEVDRVTGEFIPAGRAQASGPEWRDARGTVIRVLSPEQPVAEHRSGGLGVGDMVRALIYGPRSDAEKRALAEGTDSAGGYTVPERLASEFIDKLRAKSVVMQAGARTVPMDSDNLKIARVTGDPTVAWTAENAAIAESEPTFDVVTLAPKKLLSLVKVSRELLEDSVNINAILETVFAGAMGTEVDRACLFGSGSSNHPTGLFNISGINSVSMGTNGATPANYDDLISAMYEVQLDNGADPKVFIMHPRTNATYAKLKDANSNPLAEPKMTAEVQRLLTTAVPINQDQGTATGVCSTVLTGDFSQMLVGIRKELNIIRADQPFIANDQVAFLARLRVDVAVTNPVHFCKLIGVKP